MWEGVHLHRQAGCLGSMKYLAISVLGILGIVEFVLRILFTFFLVVSILGLIVVMTVVEDNREGIDVLLKPYSYKLIEQILETDRVKVKRLERLESENLELRQKNNELVETVYHQATS